MRATLQEITQAIFSEGEPWKTGCSKDSANDVAEGILKAAPSATVRIIQDWIWLDVETTDQEERNFSEDGVIPAVLFAHKIIRDLNGGMRPGNWVCTTAILKGATSWPIVQTKNSHYVLVGPGYRRAVHGGVVLSIINGALFTL